MSNSNRRQREIFNEINITPLTDIFLVLLIIMMVIAPLLDQQGLSLSTPSSKNPDKSKQSKIITIDVSDKGAYSIDGSQASPDSLVFKIKDAAKKKKDGLLIQASDNAYHGDVVKVMDAARNAGVANISLIEK